MAGVLAQSSNLGALLISRRLPSTAALESELRAFGLGSLTGVDLPGESQGLLAPSSKWSIDQAATIPYGQGMSVNALQVADAYATIANGGVRVTPKIIAGTINGKGKVEPTANGPTHRVVSPQTAKTMQQLLEQVTTTASGTGAKASVAGYRVAGKTGTANRIDPNTGKYNGYVASFVGFAPADKPSLVVLVTLDNPKNEHLRRHHRCAGVLADHVVRALEPAYTSDGHDAGLLPADRRMSRKDVQPGPAGHLFSGP